MYRVIWTYNPSSFICSNTECPDPCSVLMAAFLIISSLMYANMIHCHKLGTLLKKALAQDFSCEFCKTFESTLSTMAQLEKEERFIQNLRQRGKEKAFTETKAKLADLRKYRFCSREVFPAALPLAVRLIR